MNNIDSPRGVVRASPRVDPGVTIDRSVSYGRPVEEKLELAELIADISADNSIPHSTPALRGSVVNEKSGNNASIEADIDPDLLFVDDPVPLFALTYDPKAAKRPTLKSIRTPHMNVREFNYRHLSLRLGIFVVIGVAGYIGIGSMFSSNQVKAEPNQSALSNEE